ncbi:hypothetical protein [Cohnella sp. WQ 127256]|nr:hypothetical protein [Cohnella sp. WQ 127256]
MAKSSTRKVTSPYIATKASNALSSNRTSALTKSLAGSALSQARANRKK